MVDHRPEGCVQAIKGFVRCKKPNAEGASGRCIKKNRTTSCTITILVGFGRCEVVDSKTLELQSASVQNRTARSSSFLLTGRGSDEPSPSA